jgi:hypothetical protein
MADYFKHVKGHIAHITCYTKRAKPPFIKGLRQLREEVRLTMAKTPRRITKPLLYH